MFGFGASEIITIVIVAIIVIKPDDFPRLVRKTGRIYAKTIRRINGLKKQYREFEDEVKFSGDLNITGKSTSRMTHGNQKITGGDRK